MSKEQATDEYRRLYGTAPAIVTQAPGRVNLIGEHTDYNEGFVFPAAIDRFVWVAASFSSQPEYISCELGESGDWAKYPEGVAWVLRQDGFQLRNLRAVVASDLPIGAGVSSSAALELAFAVAWNELEELHLADHALARSCQRCENEFIGLKTGLMDQMASARGRAGYAMFYDTRTQDMVFTRIPEGVSIVVADTTKGRELASSKYNERRESCEQACLIMGVTSLRDCDLAMLEDAPLDDVLFRRARHVVTENARCLEFEGALESADRERVGSLMKASHESLRDDYEVSCAELDAMAEACWSTTGCIGARMTGAGFGGACVALVQEESVTSFCKEAAQAYFPRTGIEGRFMVCKAADGARRVA